jgi:hypothetical protein
VLVQPAEGDPLPGGLAPNGPPKFVIWAALHPVVTTARQLVVPHLPEGRGWHNRRDLVGMDTVPAIKLPTPACGYIPASW